MARTAKTTNKTEATEEIETTKTSKTTKTKKAESTAKTTKRTTKTANKAAAKTTTKTEPENEVDNKLKYIGLNLNRIPAFLKEHESLNFRPSKSYDDTIYKVYRYVNIKNIEILITPRDRLTDLKEKYKLASPIRDYLDKKNIENAEKHEDFMKLVETINEKRIEEIAKEQEELNEKIPYEVKYPNNYIWQIYYSENAKKYFMLATTKEQDNNAMLYLLKEQIANTRSRKGKYIFVPISHLEYSGLFLTKSEISDVENYLWYFTKEWPNVYEIFDKDNNLFIKIVGVTNIYDKIKTTYSINLDSKEEALNFYKLLKAMFILATGAKEEFKFVTKINADGQIEFWHKDHLVKYENLSEYIKLEYLDKIDRLKKEVKDGAELERKLSKFKVVIEELTQDYLQRQRQIATFLECKKTFFGKVKYFFKKKKDNKDIRTLKEQRPLSRREESKTKNDESKDETLKELYALKQQYTIEDLINICTKLEEVVKKNTNLKLDIKAIETKKDILTKKIDNADLYIKEIDKHKKSIFEFWKFTSKDEVQTLNEAEEQEKTEHTKMRKYFDYKDDLEDLGKIVDEVQRRKLSKNETDAIFVLKQVPESFKELNSEKETDVEVFVEKEEEAKPKKRTRKKENQLATDLENLKKEYENDIEVINSKDFDIFGGLIEDKTKVKSINNEKHREIEKDKFKILNINLDTDIKAYTENLESYLALIKEALNKIKSPYDMSVYCINNKKTIEGINIFNMNPKEALKEELSGKKSKITLCKINIKENTPAVFYSNIIFYDNFNKTLPVGMNLSSEIVLDVNKLKLDFVKEDTFYINYKVNEFEFATKEVQIYEYNSECKSK